MKLSSIEVPEFGISHSQPIIEEKKPIINEKEVVKEIEKPKTVKKEIAFGAAMAVASVYMSGHHHHHITMGELEQTMITEAVNFASSINFEKKKIVLVFICRYNCAFDHDRICNWQDWLFSCRR